MGQRPISHPSIQHYCRHCNRPLFVVSSFFFNALSSVQAPRKTTPNTSTASSLPFGCFPGRRVVSRRMDTYFSLCYPRVPMTLRILEARLRDSKRIPPAWRSRKKEALRLLEVLASRFPGAAARSISFGFVPGRIEVFGRHTDYAGGRSLVCAIDRGFLYAAVPGQGRRVRMYEESAEFEPVEFELSPSLRPRIGHWRMSKAERLRRHCSQWHATCRNWGASNFICVSAKGNRCARHGWPWPPLA